MGLHEFHYINKYNKLYLRKKTRAYSRVIHHFYRIYRLLCAVRLCWKNGAAKKWTIFTMTRIENERNRENDLN